MYFSEGLTIVTGETGAGKSILLGALGLVMGERADTKVLYHEGEKCVVECRFLIEEYDLEDFFRDNDLDYNEELIIRREIVPSGKSRAFVNDTPVNLKVLQELSATLVDLHQQFDLLDIHNVNFQLRLLDALAGNRHDLESYQRDYREYATRERRLHELRERSATAARDMDYIQFQLEEFHKAELGTGEQEMLEEELTRLTNAEEIKRVTAAAFQFLSESEQSVVSQLQEIGVSLNHIGKVDASVRQLYERLQGLTAELQDVSSELENIADATEYDGERIQQVQERLDLIYRLQKKHTAADVDELLEIQARLEGQLSDFEDLSGSIERLEAELATREADLRTRAQRLRERRKGVTADFARHVCGTLATLGMPAAQLEIVFRELPALTSTGLDEVEFLFTANRGGRLQPIREVASGGELSRLTLVTKSLVASAMALPTLIFDEIDSGVSGDISLKMGAILRSLSNHHQVVVITHSPQVASQAEAHYYVYKVDGQERTTTKVRLLTEEERIRAIAIMLSQSPPSEIAMENARELMRVVKA